MLGITFGAADRLKLGIKEGSELGLSNSPFDCSNNGIPEGAVLRDGDTLEIFRRNKDGTRPGNTDELVLIYPEVT